jgi:copper transport protein
VSQPQQAGAYTISLKVAPATFGVNTFTVTVKDAQGRPVNGATALVQTIMLDMDMGTQNVDLKPMGADAPGSYFGQGDLTMAGNWDVVVKVLTPGASDYVSTSFKFVASY